MPLGVEHALDALGEPDDIAVIALEQRFILLMDHTDHIDSADGTRLGRNAVEERNHLLFIRDGDVETFKVGIAVDDLGEFINRGNLKVLVLGIDAFVGKLLVEVADGERMSQGVTDKSVLVHKFSIYLVAKYMVQMPKVSLRNEASANPAFIRISTMRSPWGKASMVFVR